MVYKSNDSHSLTAHKGLYVNSQGGIYMIATRRPCVTQSIEFQGQKYHVTVGFDPDSLDPCEVWAWGPKTGSASQFLIHDVAYSMSHQLQGGETPEDLASKPMRDSDGSPLSVMGVLADELMQYV